MVDRLLTLHVENYETATTAFFSFSWLMFDFIFPSSRNNLGEKFV